MATIFERDTASAAAMAMAATPGPLPHARHAPHVRSARHPHPPTPKVEGSHDIVGHAELELTPEADGVPTKCVVNFDNINTVSREVFQRRVTTLAPARMAEACQVLRDATGC